MQSIEDFESWVKTKGGQKGLVASFVRRFPKEKAISQTAVSNWVTRRVIPLERRPQLKILGWDGPWEWPQEADPAPAVAAITREEFVELKTAVKVHVEYWEKGEKKVLERLEALARKIDAIGRHVGFPE